MRLHCHAYFRRDRDKVQVPTVRRFVFKGTQPDRRSFAEGAKVRAGGGWSAMYYLQCPKIGQVFSSGNKQPFEDYPVNASWIFNLVQSGKFDYQVARKELVRTTQGLTRKLQDLEKWHEERRLLELEGHIAVRQAELRQQIRPFRRLEQVDLWLAEAQTVSMRKKFLVLEGPSGTAKTQFAKGLLGVEATYELNMAKTDDFCLRGFRPLTHRVVLWDEARPKLVSDNRKLFQCPAAWVDLGQSPTGTYVYWVWVNDAVMVICSNKWSQLLAKLPLADAEWVKDNQVLVMVPESLIA